MIMAEKINSKPLKNKNSGDSIGPVTRSSNKVVHSKTSTIVKPDKKFSRFILRRPSTLKKASGEISNKKFTDNSKLGGSLTTGPKDFKTSRSNGSRFFTKSYKSTTTTTTINTNNCDAFSNPCQNEESKFENNLVNASDFIEALSSSICTPFERLLTVLNTLRITIKNNPVSWAELFGEEGTNRLLFTVGQMHHKTKSNKGEEIHLECIRCLKELVYKKQDFCLSKIMLLRLVQSLDHDYPSIMKEALDILSIACFVPKGHKTVLKVLTECCNNSLQRFEPIIAGLKMRNNTLAIGCFRFMNSIISAPEDLDTRLHLRNEFLMVGLRDVLNEIEVTNDYCIPEFIAQLQVFHKYREEDCDKIFARFDNLRFQFDDMDECFELLKSSVMGTESEPLLLSILQHLLYIRDIPEIRVAYYRLIEECISQIVIHHSGCDPDFRTSRKIHIYVYPETGILPEKGKDDDENSTLEYGGKLEEIILAKQLFEDKISQLEQALLKYKDQAYTSSLDHIQEQQLPSIEEKCSPLLPKDVNVVKTNDSNSLSPLGKVNEKRSVSLCTFHVTPYSRNSQTVWAKKSNLKRDEASFQNINTKTRENMETRQHEKCKSEIPRITINNTDKANRQIQNFNHRSSKIISNKESGLLGTNFGSASLPTSDTTKEPSVASAKHCNRHSANIDGPQPSVPWHYQ